jgi:hypothetical protein
MSKRLKIIIALCAVTTGIIIIGVITIGAVGYGVLSSKSRDAEMIFPATDVGTPVGNKVSKEIGRAGGSIVSPDGRLTLSIPQNALLEPVAFSIQPITDKAGQGLGLGYRLEPNGKTFATPLEVSFHYDEHDLEGIAAETLALAYQDQKGAWRAQASTTLDQASKTLTIAITHFTDFALVAGLQMSPPEATVYAGQVQFIRLIQCKEQTRWDVLWSHPLDCVRQPAGTDSWSLVGPGKIADTISGDRQMGVTYTAPATKPSPNIAWVKLTVDFTHRFTNGETINERRTFVTKITILDRAYKASGRDGPISYEGVICDLEKPFFLTGIHPLLMFHYAFSPSSSMDGTASFSEVRGAKGTGSGPYKVVGTGTDKMQIVWHVTSTVSIGGQSSGGTGDAHILLTPLEANDRWPCGSPYQPGLSPGTRGSLKKHG